MKRVADSCGWGVPLLDFVGPRDHHGLSAAKRVRTMGAEAYDERERARHLESLDGLPSFGA